MRHPPDGQRMQAMAAVLLEACNEFRSLAQEFPDNAQYQFSLAQCLRHRLVHASSTREPGVASDTFHEAVRILEQLAEKSPNEPKYLFELADTRTHASRALSGEDAEEPLRRSVADADQLASRFPAVPEYQLLLGGALAQLATIQESRGGTDDAKQNLTRSIAILERLGARFRDQGIIQIPLAKTRRQLGDLLRQSANGDAASSRLDQSQAVLQQAITDFESYLSAVQGHSQFNQHTQSSLYRSLGETLTRLNLPEQAAAARRKADAESQRGPGRGPDRQQPRGESR